MGVSPLPFLLAAAGAALAAACAAPGPYPSLKPRPIETSLAAADEAPEPAPAPESAAVRERTETFLADIRGTGAAFEAALASARAAVARAGAPEGEGWIEAQQAISRLEAARAPTVRALADLDAYALEEARSGRAGSPADLALLRRASEEAQAIANRQQAEIDALKGRLRPI
jgi:hypothetical protein